jgi:hypothetical protein
MDVRREGGTDAPGVPNVPVQQAADRNGIDANL